MECACSLRGGLFGPSCRHQEGAEKKAGRGFPTHAELILNDFEIALARILEYLPGRLECDVRRGYPQICALNCQPGQTLEKKVGKMCTRLKQESMNVHKSSISHKHRKKLARSEQPRICVESHCANIGRFGTMLLLCGFATGCNKTHWHGRAQENSSDVATLLAKRDRSYRLLNAL